MRDERRLLLILLAACLVLFSFQTGNHDFWDPDEPRYAGVARSMLETGDWIRLQDNGEFYTHKPPLYFWILVAAAKLGGGLSETTARIPSGIAALVCVAAVFGLGGRLFGYRAGWLGAMALATSQRFFLEARWVHIDSVLTLFVVLAMSSAHSALHGKRRNWVWMYAWMALGCLAKGPLAPALPIAGLLVYLATRRELSRIRETGWPWGVVLCLAPSLAWLFASTRLSGIDPVGVVRKQVLQRLQEGLHHPRPLYYYLYALPLEFLPWTLFLPSILRFTFPVAGRRDRASLLFLYGWIVGGLALLSLVAEKRPSYLLPLFPPLALLLGVFFDSYLTRYDASPMKRWIGGSIAVGGFACLAGTMALTHLGNGEPGLRARIVPLGVFLFVAWAGALWAHQRGHRGAALVALLAGTSLGYLGIVGAVFPWLNGYKSARPFCERIISRIGDAPLGIYGDYRPSLAYYTHRRLEVLRGGKTLDDFLGEPRGGYCIVRKEELGSTGARTPIRSLEEASVGHRAYVLVGRDPSASIREELHPGDSPR